jgi:hypothetical protein
VGWGERTAAPVAERRVTRGAADVITLAGRLSASETIATTIGVMAVAISEPRAQNIGTTIAAATAARLEIRRVWTESVLGPFGSFSRLTPSTLALDP